MDQHTDFGVTDRLGRAIGYVVTLKTWGYVQGIATDGLWFDGQATRNGSSHQASTRHGPFATEAERDAKAAKVVEAARKRALSPAARLKA